MNNDLDIIFFKIYMIIYILSKTIIGFFLINIIYYFCIINKKYDTDQLYSKLKYYNLKINNLYNNLFKINKKEIIFIKDGTEIIKYDLNKKKFITLKINISFFSLNNVQYDYVLYIDSINIIRYNTINDYLNNNIYKKIDPLFLSLKLSLNNKEYFINLNDPNYYIENNILFDYKFLKWFCLINFNFNIEKDDNYNIIILDKNIKEYKLHKFNSIKFTNNNFEILNDSTHMLDIDKDY